VNKVLIQNSVAFVLLVVATLVALYASYDWHKTTVSVFVVLALLVFKGQQIVDVFMELRHAPSKWRYLVLSYVVLVPAILFAVIYL
jgi:cytochrome c oxidase subunit IV